MKTSLNVCVFASLFAVAILAIALGGCNSNSADAPNSSAETPPPGVEPDHENEGAPDLDTGLAELSPEDAESAKAQKMCPVSEEALGSMGAPKKMDIDGKLVWICCEGCEDRLKANPATYLAKLNKGGKAEAGKSDKAKEAESKESAADLDNAKASKSNEGESTKAAPKDDGTQKEDEEKAAGKGDKPEAAESNDPETTVSDAKKDE